MLDTTAAQAHLLFTVLLVLQHTVYALLDDVANVVWCKSNLCKVSMQRAWLRFVPTDNMLLPAKSYASSARLVNVRPLLHPKLRCAA
jgi:hypothetical protein